MTFLFFLLLILAMCSSTSVVAIVQKDYDTAHFFAVFASIAFAVTGCYLVELFR